MGGRFVKPSVTHGNRATQYENMVANYGNTVQQLENLYNDLIRKRDTLYQRRADFQGYLINLDQSMNTIGGHAQYRLQQYVGKPANDFIKSYTPDYISNNSTLFLRVNSYSKGTGNVYALDDEGNRINVPAQPIKAYDLLEDDTTYENTFTVEEINPNNFLYDAEVVKLTEEQQKLFKRAYVMFYDKNKELIYNIDEYGTFDLSDGNIAEDPVSFLDIAPGTRVSIMNGAGVINKFDNSPNATGNKRIELNSSMTSGGCNSSDVDKTRCLMTRITITKY